ncbi:MAG: phosphatidylcholine/phosphatidylserine synthase [Planctomycetes bacterium]|nr:phosphatidylcholine/phosphatidylserine synthase [Planctomycetota bacterium]
MFIRLGSKSKAEIPVAALIPNVLTTLALSSGLASIHFSLMEKWEKAIIAIALSMVFDTLDGRAARLLRVSSKFGAVLDSLSDFVSFGVAPAIILHQWLLKSDPVPAKAVVTPLELAAVMIYALCAGLRLARFTATPPAPKSAAAANYFVGMPTPAAAAAVMIPAMIMVSDDITWRPPEWVSMSLAFVIGLLMVSRVPTFAFKKLTINRRLVAPLLILVGLFVVSLATHFWATLAGLAAFNLALTPVSWIMRARSRSAEVADAAMHAGTPAGSSSAIAE